MVERREGDAGESQRVGRRADDLRHELLSRVAGQVGEGVAVFDNADLLLYANPALAALQGCSAEALVGRHLTAIVDVASVASDWAVAEALGDEVLRAEMSGRRWDGTRLDVDVTVSSLVDDTATRIGKIVCVRDVTVRKQLEERLARAALHDPLTDLPNRQLLSDRLEHALAVAERTGVAAAVLFIDLDGFKRVNDLYGHGAGDELLVQVADRFKSCVRNADTLARLGGDEFVVLIEHVTDPTQPIVTAQRLIAALLSPFELGGTSVAISASIGVAASASDSQRSLLHAADSAMYRAKGAGPGRIVAGQEEETPTSSH